MRFVYRQSSGYRAAFNPELCAASVTDGGRSVYSHQCRRKWKIEEEGHKWCRTHAPSAEEARRRAADDRYREEQRRRDVARRSSAIQRVLRELRDLGETDLAVMVEAALTEREAES